MNDLQQGEFPIGSENDIVSARKLVRNAAVALGFGLTDVTRIVTAASELTRNIYIYAKSGVMRDIPDQGTVLGIPAAPDKQAKRQMIALQQLPELIRRTRDLEKQVAELRGRAGG